MGCYQTKEMRKRWTSLFWFEIKFVKSQLELADECGDYAQVLGGFMVYLVPLASRMVTETGKHVLFTTSTSRSLYSLSHFTIHMAGNMV